MKAIIIEDEIVAAKRLKKLINEIDADIEIEVVLSSVVDTVNFLAENNPNLIFMDIQLADGTCFEIFEQLEINSPIIFTTAYNEYMQKAFQVNSVDYLLKPIQPVELERSISKFKKYQLNIDTVNNQHIQELLMQFNTEIKQYKSRFLVKSGKFFISLYTKDIAYIISENKLNYLIHKSGKKYVLDYTLDHLEQLLDPFYFCRISRNYIVSYDSIIKIEPYFNNRMLLYLDPDCGNDDVLVSRSHLVKFRDWVDR